MELLSVPPSGHEIAISEPCASFHNLSLASLCWITLTMLHRPYWVKRDIYIGFVAALIEFGCNICRPKSRRSTAPSRVCR